MLISSVRNLIVLFFLVLAPLYITPLVHAQNVDVSTTETVVSGNTYSTTVNITPSENVALQGYDLTLEFNSDDVTITNIEYLLGRVSSGLGDENNTLNNVNSSGSMRLQGEIASATGATVNGGAPNGIVRVTYSKQGTKANPVTLRSGSDKFYKINPADGSLTSLSSSIQQPPRGQNGVNGNRPAVPPQAGQERSENKNSSSFLDWFINFFRNLFSRK